jgi:16S rRNA (guanine527-N7)-methyltransferase
VSRLEAYLALLERWNPRINLVGPATLAAAATRHILDSAQIFPLLPVDTASLIDLGAGSGLPGLVLAIMGVPDVHLVESDARKAAFLGEAARLTATKVTIHPTRIEALPPIPADIVTARALKPLDQLLRFARRFQGPRTACYFHKGASWQSELDAARRAWRFRATAHPSLTDPSAVVLELREIERVG